MTTKTENQKNIREIELQFYRDFGITLAEAEAMLERMKAQNRRDVLDLYERAGIG